MGLMMSFPGKGLSTKVIGKVTEKFRKEFVDKNIKDFEEFHLAILKMFISVNEALPGKHWNVPYKEIEDCYNRWERQKDADKKEEEVLNFLKENIKPSKIDKTSLIIGMATPPVAMATKKAGERVPQLKFIRSVPDVLFVPAATLLALASSKALRIYFHKSETPSN